MTTYVMAMEYLRLDLCLQLDLRFFPKDISSSLQRASSSRATEQNMAGADDTAVSWLLTRE